MAFSFKQLTRKKKALLRFALSFVLLGICLSTHIYMRLVDTYLPRLHRQAERSLAAFKGDDPSVFESRVNERYENLKGRFQNPEGRTFLLEYDPYAWAIRTGNVLRYGDPGDIRISGKSFDSFMYAPLGYQIPPENFMFYLSAGLYRLGNWISYVSFENFLFFLPVFYSCLFFTLFYLFMRRWFSDPPAFLAVFLLGLLPIFVRRGSAGRFDTDMLNLLLSLAVVWALQEAVRDQNARSTKVAFWSLVGATFYGLLMVSWMGHWFILACCVFFYVFLSLVRRFERGGSGNAWRPKLQQLFFSAGLFFFSSFLLGWLIGADIPSMLSSVRDGFMFARVGGQNMDLWPNVYLTIAEILPLNLRMFFSEFQGVVPFGIMVAGACVAFFVMVRRRQVVMLGMIIPWLLITLFLMLRAKRILFYWAVPFYLLTAVFWGQVVWERIVFLKSRFWKAGFSVCCAACVLFLLVSSLFGGLASAQGVCPIINRGWYDVLMHLKTNVPKNAIINGWWDYGDWIKYYAQRRVLFDNQIEGDKNSQIGYWMGRALMSSDEEESFRILRMLNNASCSVFGLLRDSLRDSYRARVLLERLLAADPKLMPEILKSYHVPEKVSIRVIRDLEARPAPAYLVTDGAMLGKIPSLYYLGRWDFVKRFMWRRRLLSSSQILQQVKAAFDVSDAASKLLLEQLALGAKKGLVADGYFPDGLLLNLYGSRSGEKGPWVRFGSQIFWNSSTKKSTVLAGSRQFSPRKNVFVEDGKPLEIADNKGRDDISVIFKRDKAGFSAFALDGKIEGSLLVRLGLFDGAGLRHFKLIYKDIGYRIYVYEIVWKEDSAKIADAKLEMKV